VKSQFAVIGAALIAGFAASAAAQPPAGAQAPISMLGDRSEGQKLFNDRCASCHNGSVERAPPKEALSSRGPDDVIHAMTDGVMRPMAAGLTERQMQMLALYLTGKLPVPQEAIVEKNLCAKADPIKLAAGSWNGWSPDLANSRYQPAPGIKAADVPRLKVKWTFAYNGSKNSTPVVVGDRLFVGSTAGKIYSLNAKTGCVYWRYDNKGGVRAAPVVGRSAKAPSGYAVYINDDRMNVNALDALSGKLLWSLKIEQHPRAMLTGSPALFGDVLYVPVSSAEEITTNEPDYACCTFRGSIVAVDTKTGKQLWKTYTTDEAPHPHRISGGRQLMGPAGGAIWSAPTVDAKRGLVFAATGDSYTDVDHKGSDAIIAFEMKSGKIRWTNQLTQKDNFIVGCPRPGTAAPIPANCPTPVGPDVDFGSSPILRTLPGGKQILLAGQKSSAVYGIDPDSGKTLWTKVLGRGGATGGVEWGMAADDSQLYVALADAGAGGKPGISALKFGDGAVVWNTPAPPCPAPAVPGRRCTLSQSAPVSAIPGLAFSGAMDGHLRAYDVKDGKIVWDFDTAAEAYNTANGVTGARGGPIDATGATIVGGMLYQHSGYGGVMAGPTGQNLLMAFSVDGK
jgi:polyvinyl alcohol dehydrogenase (cytochrome)